MENLSNKIKVLLFAGIIALASCSTEDDPTEPVNDQRDNFVGLWSVTESSKVFGQNVYDSEIIKNSSNENNVAIDNFYQLGENVVIQARVNGSLLEVFTQTTSTNQVIKGNGELVSKNTIEFTYTVDDGAVIDTVNSSYFRK